MTTVRPAGSSATAGPSRGECRLCTKCVARVLRRDDSAGRAPILGPMPTTTPEMLETEALTLLRELAGPDATFREHQLEAVVDLVDGRRRGPRARRAGAGQRGAA